MFPIISDIQIYGFSDNDLLPNSDLQSCHPYKVMIVPYGHVLQSCLPFADAHGILSFLTFMDLQSCHTYRVMIVPYVDGFTIMPPARPRCLSGRTGSKANPDGALSARYSRLPKVADECIRANTIPVARIYFLGVNPLNSWAKRMHSCSRMTSSRCIRLRKRCHPHRLYISVQSP